MIIYEYNSEVHGRVQLEVGRQLGNFNVNNANNSLGVSVELDLMVALNNVRRADGAVKPRGLPQRPAGQGMNANNDPYPTLVIEVGVSENVDSLHGLALEYFSARTRIRAYLALKIWELRNSNTFAALALLYLRNNVPNSMPVQAISFGTAPIHRHALNSMPQIIPPLIVGNHGPAAVACSAAGLAGFQINIPTAEMYHGVPAGVPVGVPAQLQIDLFHIQNVAY